MAEGVWAAEGDGFAGIVHLGDKVGGLWLRPDLLGPVAVTDPGLRVWWNREWLSLIWQFGHSLVGALLMRQPLPHFATNTSDSSLLIRCGL